MFRRRSLRRKLTAAGAPPVPADRLRRLVKAIDAGPRGAECVPLACPHLADRIRRAAGRIYRFPELRDGEELRRMPICADREMKCCNPYHWSRVCTPEHCDRIETFAPPDHGTETPPPPYSRCVMNEVQSKDHGARAGDARRTDHERLFGGSVATDGEERQSWDAEWCRLAYWELTRRVGRQFGVRVSAVDVFRGDGAGCGSGRHGFCLDALDQTDGPQIEQVRRTRAKIGLGVTISLESSGVWVYNRSAEPVFISSPALDASVARALLVWRVPPGYCLRVYNPDSPPAAAAPPHVGPVDSRSVRISFAKGWGPKYSRRDVTGCPCWLEVMLAPPR